MHVHVCDAHARVRGVDMTRRHVTLPRHAGWRLTPARGPGSPDAGALHRRAGRPGLGTVTAGKGRSLALGVPPRRQCAVCGRVDPTAATTPTKWRDIERGRSAGWEWQECPRTLALCDLSTGTQRPTCKGKGRPGGPSATSSVPQNTRTPRQVSGPQCPPPS